MSWFSYLFQSKDPECGSETVSLAKTYEITGKIIKKVSGKVGESWIADRECIINYLHMCLEVPVEHRMAIFVHLVVKIRTKNAKVLDSVVDPNIRFVLEGDSHFLIGVLMEFFSFQYNRIKPYVGKQYQKAANLYEKVEFEKPEPLLHQCITGILDCVLRNFSSNRSLEKNKRVSEVVPIEDIYSQIEKYNNHVPMEIKLDYAQALVLKKDFKNAQKFFKQVLNKYLSQFVLENFADAPRVVGSILLYIITLYRDGKEKEVEKLIVVLFGFCENLLEITQDPVSVLNMLNYWRYEISSQKDFVIWITITGWQLEVTKHYEKEFTEDYVNQLKVLMCFHFFHAAEYFRILEFIKADFKPKSKDILLQFCILYAWCLIEVYQSSENVIEKEDPNNLSKILSSIYHFIHSAFVCTENPTICTLLVTKVRLFVLSLKNESHKQIFLDLLMEMAKIGFIADQRLYKTVENLPQVLFSQFSAFNFDSYPFRIE